MKEQLQSLDKSRDGLMVTFEHHAKVWRDLEREKERKFTSAWSPWSLRWNASDRTANIGHLNIMETVYN